MNQKTKLTSLDKSLLIEQLKTLVQRERKLCVEVLKYLIEVERRQLHVTLGYSSMFSYVRGELKFSEGAAYRRIACARLMAECPEVEGYLVSGELSLCTGSMLKGVLTKDNKAELLGLVKGKSKREVEEIVLSFRPGGSLPRDRVRAVKVGGVGNPSKNVFTFTSKSPVDRSRNGESAVVGGGIVADNDQSSLSDGIGQLVERMVEYKFVGSKRSEELLNEVRRLPGQIGSKGLGELFEKLLESYLERECPRRRAERRKARKAKAELKQAGEILGDEKSLEKSLSGKVVTRHIPQAVRDSVFIRDGFRCTYVGENGKRCEARECLELDHVKRWSIGGEHRVENLRVACRVHNLHWFEKVCGRRYGS